MTKITIPQLDANLVDVTVTKWSKKIGDPVAKGEIIGELTTDKAVYDLECPADGTLIAIYAQEKSVVPTGYTVGMVGAADETAPESLPENEKLMADYAGPIAAVTVKRERGARVRATPKARRLAKEHNLDLAKIQAETGAELVDEKVLAAYLK